MVELAIADHNEITVFLHHYLNLSIILAQPYGKDWFMEHFVTVFSVMDKEPWKLYLDFMVHYGGILEQKGFPYQDFDSNRRLLEFISGEIQQRRYVTIYLDEYYIPGKDVYQKWHFVHNSLIYGYDPQSKTFHGLGFTKNQVLKRFSISYDILALAYEMGKQYYQEGAAWLAQHPDEAIMVSGLKFTDYVLNLKYLIDTLKDYLKPALVLQQLGLVEAFIGKKISSTGIGMYDDILVVLRNALMQKSILDYRTFHFVYEHKEIIHQRLEWLQQNFRHILPHDISEQIVEYKTIKSIAATMKNLYIKQALLESNSQNLYISIKEPRVIEQFIQYVEILKSTERKILLNTGILEITIG
jgi:hypothetical protein